jgi:hypothetical protein
MHHPKVGLGYEWMDEKSGSNDPLLDLQILLLFFDYEIMPQILA